MSSVTDIPSEFKIDPYKCDKYLINGDLRKWEGKTSDVFSSISTKK
jgi:hypothetical protein